MRFQRSHSLELEWRSGLSSKQRSQEGDKIVEPRKPMSKIFFLSGQTFTYLIKKDHIVDRPFLGSSIIDVVDENSFDD